ncbi:hypothetical protein B0I35DRAFT_442580 [Stachybotrys elegans]|uniref:Uncharacterized protein n=1 Tax=Stachybotrys elegans TaxID=80388 RepID=A0A8K0SH29_9HYPO|nr:hypothetical protein B0I35DRAFT_442580 [Stachybotrys elegans]
MTLGKRICGYDPGPPRRSHNRHVSRAEARILRLGTPLQVEPPSAQPQLANAPPGGSQEDDLYSRDDACTTPSKHRLSPSSNKSLEGSTPPKRPRTLDLPPTDNFPEYGPARLREFDNWLINCGLNLAVRDINAPDCEPYPAGSPTDNKVDDGGLPMHQYARRESITTEALKAIETGVHRVKRYCFQAENASGEAARATAENRAWRIYNALTRRKDAPLVRSPFKLPVETSPEEDGGSSGGTGDHRPALPTTQLSNH